MDFSQLANQRKEKITKEIHTELGKESDVFMATVWATMKFKDQPLPVLPGWIVQDYKKAVLNTPPEKLQVHSIQHHLINKAKLKDLCFGQVGIIVSIFAFCNPSSYCGDDFDMYIEKRRELDKLMMIIKDMNDEKDDRLREKLKFRFGMYDQKTWMPFNGNVRMLK